MTSPVSIHTGADARKIVIVGGVAGGMSCAARARRLSEKSTIVVFERGPYPSFANCGLPYHIGGEIADKAKLIVQSAESLRKRLNLDVRIGHEVVAINRAEKTVTVRNLTSGETFLESYDVLVLSPGAEPLRPPIPGINRPGHFTLRNIPDMEAILAWLEKTGGKRAVIGGGGYIGLEVAEQLRHRGLEVAIAEMAPQVMVALDPEIAAHLHAEIRRNGIELYLGNGLDHFAEPEEGAHASTVVLKDGTRLPADLVILGLGVKPESQLARMAELSVGQRGGILVDPFMRTSDSSIYAVGDAVEVWDPSTGDKAQIPLAGPANRQGRLVADHLFGLPVSPYRGTQGTAALRLFELTAACTGLNEKTLRLKDIPYEAVHLHPASHASYYPGAFPLSLKILFNTETGVLLGAQAVGKDGAEKRIDVLATAIAAGMTVEQIAQLELCYAPPLGSAKDPINLAGMIASNIRQGLLKQIQWHEVEAARRETGAVVLDVRDPKECAGGAIPGSVNIPLDTLRGRISEVPTGVPLIVHCATGLRSYYANRILLQNGFSDVRNLSGSWKTWSTAKS